MSENFEKIPIGKLRELIGRTREGTDINNRRERPHIAESNDPWFFYRKNASDYIDTFAITFPDIAALPGRLKERHERGERVLVVDLCGVANAKDIGADETIAFTLNKPRHIPETESFSIVEGDIFSTKGQKSLMGLIDTKQIPISCVFMSPVAGMKAYDENLFTHLKLYNLLGELYARLAEDGEIYADVSEFGTGAAILQRALEGASWKKFFFSLGPLDERRPHISRFHIIKTKGAPPVLPEMKDLLLSDDDRKVLQGAIYDHSQEKKI